MKISVFVAAAIAAGAMTIASHAQDASSDKNEAAASAAASKSEGGNFLQQLLRAGDASARIGISGSSAVEVAKAKEEAKTKVASIDPSTTGSVQESAAASKAKTAQRPYHAIVSRYAAQYGVPVSLAHAVISLESNYRPSARGRAGEIGLMQIKPATARAMGYSGSAKALYHPETNIKYGMKYLGGAFKLGGGKTCAAILKYNAGHGAKRMNPISSAYCAKVKRILASG